MNRQFFSLLSLLCICTLCTSCAYMQTHKQVEEMGCHYHGKLLSNQKCSTWNIYKSEGHWYLPAQVVTLQKDYPIVKDTILHTENNEPEYQIIRKDAQDVIMYHRISEGTAHVLMRQDGYADIEDLTEEIKATPGEWKSTLKGAKVYPIRAEIKLPKRIENCIIVGERTPRETPIMNNIFSKVDFLVIDVPGTVLYNLAIPIMAPIKFFSEFSLTD